MRSLVADSHLPKRPFIGTYPNPDRTARDDSALMQFGVFGFGFFQEGNVGVGVFPQSDEIFVGGERRRAASASAACEVFACKAFARHAEVR